MSVVLPAPHFSNAVVVQDLPPEVLVHVCRHLGLCDLVRVSRTCKLFRHGGMETVELPTESPVVAVLREHAFARPELVPGTRPTGCSESWVAYLARRARQRRCLEAPPIAAGNWRSVLVDATGRLLTCGKMVPMNYYDADIIECSPTLVAAMAGIRVRSVAAGSHHSLALGWDGRVYSWGKNNDGELGQGDRLTRLAPALAEGLDRVLGVATSCGCSLAVTQTGDIFSWGSALPYDTGSSLSSVIVKGVAGVRVRRVCAGMLGVAFAVAENGQLFLWGQGERWRLGHGNRWNQNSPKLVEALRGVPISSASFEYAHAVALGEDGMVYAWGDNLQRAVLGNPHVERELLPKPVEALRGVRVSNVVAAVQRSYAVADTGELWAWGCESGHGEQILCPVPKPIQSLRGIRVDAVAAFAGHNLAVADDGSVYTWGDKNAAKLGALGLSPAVKDAGRAVPTPQRIPALLVSRGL